MGLKTVLTEYVALPRAEEEEPLHRSRHPHIAEPPLLLHLIVLVETPRVGEEPLLHPHDKDHGEFQPLRGVECHEGDTVVFLLEAVYVTDEGNLVQEIEEARLLP